MSLLSGLYLGRGALQTASNALNTTAHNLSNVDTQGYTRQQVSFSTRHYNIMTEATTQVAAKEIGMGVRYSETRQVRDYFLDQTYRRESGRSAFYEVSYEALVHAQDLLGESGENNFQEAITDYWKTIQDLAEDPSSAVTQGLFVSKAQTLIERATNVYKSLRDYQNNLNRQVKKQVESLNDLGKRLAEVNEEIVKIEVGGVERANDLKDERNHILDQMAELCSISYSEDMDGFVNVQIEGTDFVKKNHAYEILLDENEYGYVTPFWSHIATKTVDENGKETYDIKNAKVFDLTREISSDINTDIGRLKAMILARGDHPANSDDLADKDTYNQEIAQSVCMNIEAEFDFLIHNIAQGVNAILKEAGYVDGSQKEYVEGLKAKLEADSDDADAKAALEDYYANSNDALFVRINDKDGWHIGNIKINDTFLQQPALLGFMKDEDSVDFETAAKLKDAFQAEKYTLNPNTEKRTNFVEFYNDLIIQVSNSGFVYKGIYENQLDTQEEAAFAREQVVGVSSDEELQFMIKFQNAYNAASRYITTVNSMLESMLAQFGA